MAEKKSSRLVDLLTLLLTRRYGVRVQEIRRLRGYPKSAEAFHRQFERDKELLRDMGFMVAAREDPDDEARAVYYLDRGRTVLRELDFDSEELAALALARRMTAHLPLVGASVRSGLSRAGEPSLEDRAPLDVVWPAPPVIAKREESRLRHLEEAIAGDRRVRMRYQALGDAKAGTREVDPYALYLRGGAWYLLGHCHLRKAPRVFRVSRIAEVKNAGRGKGPDFVVPKDFDLERYLDRYPFEMGSQSAGRVTLHFEPHEAWRVGQGLGRRGKVQRQADGSVRLELPRAQAESVVPWVLGLGPGVRIVSPPALKQEVRRLARQVAERHDPAPRRRAPLRRAAVTGRTPASRSARRAKGGR